MCTSWIIYYLYTAALVFGLMALSSTRCAQAVLYLAALFVVAALLFFTMGAEFLAVLLLVIYAGAIILLFLFVVFLLNLRTVELYNSFRSYIPVGIFMSVLLWATLSLTAAESFTEDPVEGLRELAQWQHFLWEDSNVHLFGYLLYEHLGFFTILVAIILLVVMCAVIVVTLDIDNKHRSVQGTPQRSGSASVLRLGKKLSVSTWTQVSPGNSGTSVRKA